MKHIFPIFISILILSCSKQESKRPKGYPEEWPTWYYKNKEDPPEAVPFNDDIDTIGTFVQYRSCSGDTLTTLFYKNEGIPDSIFVGEY